MGLMAQEEGARSPHHSFMVPETRLDHGFLTEPTKLASMPEDAEGSENEWCAPAGGTCCTAPLPPAQSNRSNATLEPPPRVAL